MTDDVIYQDNILDKQINFCNLPRISAIYFALLQCGYEFFFTGRSHTHNNCIELFTDVKDIPSFFTNVKQEYCTVYPYWPRAAILETASFYLTANCTHFENYPNLQKHIMSASNIADYERDEKLWNWLTEFPSALTKVLSNNTFLNYIEWEHKWVHQQSHKHRKELDIIQKCLDICVSKYVSKIQEIKLVINPIKSIYSADYHIQDNSFVFVSGEFRVDAVIHELLHQVVHPMISKFGDLIISKKRCYTNIDDSYYLNGSDIGQINAFEEYTVKKLTNDFLLGSYPNNLTDYLLKHLENN